MMFNSLINNMSDNPDTSTPENTKIQLVVAPGQHDAVRLDKYITMFVQNATRNKVQDGIKKGYVLVNGKQEKVSYKVQGNDVIDITLPKPPPPEAKAEDIPIDIVYEDDQLIVVNKEAGMVVHPAFGNWTGTLVNGLMHHAEELTDQNLDDIRPGIVHRLDKDTSGLLVVAKNDVALAKLSKQFAEHSTKRTYWAIVWGRFDEEASGTITGEIGRSKRDRKIMAVVPEGTGKPAVTHFEVIEMFDYLSLVKINLETGRTHQIRVHFAHIGRPIFGDPTYGGNSVRFGSNTGGRKQLFTNLFKKMPRQCLHAKTLGFQHPETNEEVYFESDLPEDFEYTLAQIRQHCTS